MLLLHCYLPGGYCWTANVSVGPCRQAAPALRSSGGSQPLAASIAVPQENICRFRLVSDRKVPREKKAATSEFESAQCMPVTYQIDKTKNIIHTRCIGPVTIEEVIDHFRVLERDPNCPNHVDVLLDLSEQTSIPTNENLRDVTREIGRIRNNVQFGACAIVACSDALFGMLRMLEVFTEEYFGQSHVFRTTSEAEAWLVLHSTSSTVN